MSKNQRDTSKQRDTKSRDRKQDSPGPLACVFQQDCAWQEGQKNKKGLIKKIQKKGCTKNKGIQKRDTKNKGKQKSKGIQRNKGTPKNKGMQKTTKGYKAQQWATNNNQGIKEQRGS